MSFRFPLVRWLLTCFGPGFWSQRVFGSDAALATLGKTTLGVTSVKVDKRQVMPKHDVATQGSLHNVPVNVDDVVDFFDRFFTFDPYGEVIKGFSVSGGGGLFPTPESGEAVHFGSKNVLAWQGTCLVVCLELRGPNSILRARVAQMAVPSPVARTGHVQEESGTESDTDDASSGDEAEGLAEGAEPFGAVHEAVGHPVGTGTLADFLDYAQAPHLRPGYAAAGCGASATPRVVNGLGETVFVLDIADRGMKTTLDVASMLLKYISSEAVLTALKDGHVQIVVGDHYAYRILRTILEQDCAGLNATMVASEPTLLKSVHATLAKVFDTLASPPAELLYRATRQVLAWQGFCCFVVITVAVISISHSVCRRVSRGSQHRNRPRRALAAVDGITVFGRYRQPARPEHLQAQAYLQLGRYGRQRF